MNNNSELDALENLVTGINKIIELNEVYKNVVNSPADIEVLSSFNKAYETKKSDDIEHAIKQAYKLDNDNPYKKHLLSVLESMVILNKIDSEMKDVQDTNTYEDIDFSTDYDDYNIDDIINSYSEVDNQPTLKNNETTENVLNEYKTAIVSKNVKKPVKEERIFSDEARINKNHSYLSANNAYNLGYLNEIPEVIPVKATKKVNDILTRKIELSDIKKSVTDFKNKFSNSSEQIANSKQNNNTLDEEIENNMDVDHIAAAIVDAMIQGLVDTDGNPIDQNNQEDYSSINQMGYVKAWILVLITGILTCTFIIVGAFLLK